MLKFVTNWFSLKRPTDSNWLMFPMSPKGRTPLEGSEGLKVPGIKIKNPSCVKKTFPDFFQKLAALPSRGLGTIILDGHTGKILSGEELFAE